MEDITSADGTSDPGGVSVALEVHGLGPVLHVCIVHGLKLPSSVIDPVELNKFNLPSSIHSFNKYSLTTCNVPGTVLTTWDT